MTQKRNFPQVTITLPKEVVEEIDRRRGYLIPRSRYIRMLIERALALEKGG